MLDLGTLQAHIKLDGADTFKQELESSEVASESTSNSLQKNLLGALAKVGAGFASLISALKDLGVRFKGLMDDVAAYGDEVDKNSQKMGISAQAYQKWDYILQRNGSSIDLLQRGMKTFNTQVEGNAEAFEQLGVATRNADGSFRDTEDIMNDTIIALAGMEDGTERTALATDLFGGKVAQELLPTLNTGADGIEELGERADKLGFIMSDEGVAAAADYKDAMLDFNETVSGLKNEIGADLLPIITEIITTITDKIIPAIKEFAEENEWLAPTIAAVVSGLVAFKAAMGISLIIQGATAALAAYKAANEGATLAQWAMNAALNANPIVLIVTLIAALVGAILYLWKTNEGFRNAVLKIFEAIKSKVQNVVNAIKSAFTALANGINKAINTVKAIIAGMAAAIGAAFDKVRGFINNAVSWFTNLGSNIKSAVGNFGSLLIGAGKDLMQGLLDGITAGWKWIKDKVGGMGSWIKEHKGPKSYDLGLLVDNGGWIMKGLMDGIDKSMPALKEQLNGIAGTISGTNFDASASLAFAGGAAAIGGANQYNSNDKTYNIYINGAKINDDMQIQNQFKSLLTSMARKGMM